MAGQDFEALEAKAATREFRPVPLGATASVVARQHDPQGPLRQRRGAKLEGSDPALKDEWVIYTTHWDHFGIGPAVNGDTIYRGAIDNASGTGGLIELARAFERRRRRGRAGRSSSSSSPPRSRASSARPGTPSTRSTRSRRRWPSSTSTRSTFTGAPATSRSSASASPTSTTSSAKAAAAQGRVVRRDPMPEKGSYFRSDHFPFARKGVPSIHAGGGVDYVGKPAGLRHARARGLHPERLPQAVGRREARLGHERRGRGPRPLPPRGYELASGSAWPEWKPGAEWKPLRDEMMKAAGHALTTRPTAILDPLLSTGVVSFHSKHRSAGQALGPGQARTRPTEPPSGGES